MTKAGSETYDEEVRILEEIRNDLCEVRLQCFGEIPYIREEYYTIVLITKWPKWKVSTRKFYNYYDAWDAFDAIVEDKALE